MSDGILLDAKHGLNPGLEQCFICGEAKGVVLWGRIKTSTREALHKGGIPASNSGEAPRMMCLDKEPCPKCQEHMKQGVILISVRDPKSKEEEDNPYRTGGWVVVKEELIRRLVSPPELVEQILKKRMTFVPDEDWDMLGLPRGKGKRMSQLSGGTGGDDGR